MKFKEFLTEAKGWEYKSGMLTWNSKYWEAVLTQGADTAGLKLDLTSEYDNVQEKFSDLKSMNKTLKEISKAYSITPPIPAVPKALFDKATK